MSGAMSIAASSTHDLPAQVSGHSWRRPSFVFPSVSVATTILIFIFVGRAHIASLVLRRRDGEIILPLGEAGVLPKRSSLPDLWASV
jgi:hypothetical protein